MSLTIRDDKTYALVRLDWHHQVIVPTANLDQLLAMLGTMVTVVYAEGTYEPGYVPVETMPTIEVYQGQKLRQRISLGVTIDSERKLAAAKADEATRGSEAQPAPEGEYADDRPF